MAPQHGRQLGVTPLLLYLCTFKYENRSKQSKNTFLLLYCENTNVFIGISCIHRCVWSFKKLTHWTFKSALMRYFVGAVNKNPAGIFSKQPLFYTSFGCMMVDRHRSRLLELLGPTRWWFPLCSVRTMHPEFCLQLSASVFLTIIFVSPLPWPHSRQPNTSYQRWSYPTMERSVWWSTWMRRLSTAPSRWVAFKALRGKTIVRMYSY